MRLVKDNTYGSENPKVHGGWDGMVGELVRRVSTIQQYNSHLNFVFLLKSVYTFMF